MTRQVVVTGLGMTTPVGGDVASTWSNVLAGKSGVTAIDEPWADEQFAKIAARMAVDPKDVLDRVQARKMDRSAQAAMVAAQEAWADAGSPDVDKQRLGVVIATGMGGLISLMDGYDLVLERGPSRVSPHIVPMIMPNGAAAVVGLEFGAQAGIHTPVSACASGAEAIGYGAEMIKSGRADVVICGGTEAVIHPITMAGFGAMRALSTRNDDPHSASRPYDIDRDGFVMGEGSGVIVLESAEFAAARGAAPIAVYGGAGMTSNGYHIAQPEPEGKSVSRAITMALGDADVSPADIVHVNAHATSTPLGDVAESRGIRLALGEATDGVVVSGTKSMTGHLLGGAGAVESIFTILSLRDRVAPPTINVFNLDPEVVVDVATTQRQLPGGDAAAINDSFGFGGHDVAVVFRSV